MAANFCKRSLNKLQKHKIGGRSAAASDLSTDTCHLTCHSSYDSRCPWTSSGLPLSSWLNPMSVRLLSWWGSLSPTSLHIPFSSLCLLGPKLERIYQQWLCTWCPLSWAQGVSFILKWRDLSLHGMGPRKDLSLGKQCMNYHSGSRVERGLDTVGSTARARPPW